jgi:hypothetical protein
MDFFDLAKERGWLQDLMTMVMNLQVENFFD